MAFNVGSALRSRHTWWASRSGSSMLNSRKRMMLLAVRRHSAPLLASITSNLADRSTRAVVALDRVVLHDEDLGLFCHLGGGLGLSQSVSLGPRGLGTNVFSGALYTQGANGGNSWRLSRRLLGTLRRTQQAVCATIHNQ